MDEISSGEQNTKGCRNYASSTISKMEQEGQDGISQTANAMGLATGTFRLPAFLTQRISSLMFEWKPNDLCDLPILSACKAGIATYFCHCGKWQMSCKLM